MDWNVSQEHFRIPFLKTGDLIKIDRFSKYLRHGAVLTGIFTDQE
jgi:hypothetical protein